MGKKKKSQTTAIIAVTVIVSVTLVVILFGMGFFNTQLKMLNVLAEDGTESLLGDVAQENLIPEAPEDVSPDEIVQPTYMNAIVTPNTINIGGVVVGGITSDGRNVPISILATHLGIGQTTALAGRLDDSGQYTTPVPIEINTAGRWEFHAVTEAGLTSTSAFLTVNGINFDIPEVIYDKSEMDSFQVDLFTSHFSESAVIYADDEAHTMSYIIGSAGVNANGWCRVITSNLETWSNGRYEVNCNINGDTASAWGTTVWITVQD